MIRLGDLEKHFDLELKTEDVDTSRKVEGGYASDLLSWVMGHAKENQIWITIQNHQNIVAVALLLNLAAIIIADGVKVDNETIKKANERNLPIYTSEKSMYELCGLLYNFLKNRVDELC